jgi:hypothetical protein
MLRYMYSVILCSPVKVFDTQHTHTLCSIPLLHVRYHVQFRQQTSKQEINWNFEETPSHNQSLYPCYAPIPPRSARTIGEIIIIIIIMDVPSAISEQPVSFSGTLHHN